MALGTAALTYLPQFPGWRESRPPESLQSVADCAGLNQEPFATAVFPRLGLIATAQSYGFGAEQENVRRCPDFECQWKAGPGAELVKEGAPTRR